jgi:hydrogenase nickel incorporation protein HypA/HybF
MHEFGIANSIIDAVSAEVARIDNGARVVKVAVKIGDLSGVDAEALRFSFNAIVADTDLAPLELEIERLPHRRRCGDCSNEFEVDTTVFDAACPICGNVYTEFLAGAELDIDYLELEEL